MKRLLFTIAALGAAAVLLPSAASAAPVCTSVNKGGAAANKKIVVSSCRDDAGSWHREYAVLYIGSASTRAAFCQVSTSTVEVYSNGAAAHWTPGVVQGCNDVLRQNRSVRKWGSLEAPHVTLRAKTVTCLFFDFRKLGSCVYSPALNY